MTKYSHRWEKGHAHDEDLVSEVHTVDAFHPVCVRGLLVVLLKTGDEDPIN